MCQALVSIVVATYRSRHDHLGAAIRSALDQSWQEIEVIVSDDSPEDSLRGFVAAFGDPRLRYRHNRPALGVARNHWVSFGEAKGEYIAVLNHDDWLAPAFVERLVGVLGKQSDAVIAFCDHWIVDESGRRLDDETHRNSAAWGRTTLAEGMHLPFVSLVGDQTIPMAMGSLFRRTALPAKLPSDAGPAYDLWLSYLLCREGAGAWFVRERLAAWRTHFGSLTSQGGMSWLLGSANCWHTMARDLRFASVRRTARRKAALGYYGCAVRSWADGRRIDCVRYALSSVMSVLTLKGLAACMLPLLPTRLAPARWTRGQGRA